MFYKENNSIYGQRGGITMEKIDQVKGFAKLFSFSENESDKTEIPEIHRQAFLDENSVMAIIPKLNGVRRILETNFD